MTPLEKAAERVVEALADLVKLKGLGWTEKRDAVLVADDELSEGAGLQEFLAWEWPDSDDDDDDDDSDESGD